MPPKKISELQSAELRFRALLNKRDEINEQAAILKSERDSFNDQKKDLQDKMNAARDKRDALVAQMRIHKGKRDQLQAKAKELIEFKKKLKGRGTGNLKDEIRVMEADAKMLELRQQTVPLTIPKERELLETLKKKLAEIQRMKGVLAEQEKIEKEVREAHRTCEVTGGDLLAQQQDIVPRSEENLQLERRLNQQGDATAGEVIEAQSELLSAQRDYLEAVESYNNALIELDRVVGGSVVAL